VTNLILCQATSYISNLTDVCNGVAVAGPDFNLHMDGCNTHGFPIVTHVRTYGFRRDSHESILDASLFVDHEFIVVVAMLPSDFTVVVGVILEKFLNFAILLLFRLEQAVADWEVGRVIFLARCVVFFNEGIEFFTTAWCHVETTKSVCDDVAFALYIA
jgi:hypothetical protein